MKVSLFSVGLPTDSYIFFPLSIYFSLYPGSLFPISMDIGKPCILFVLCLTHLTFLHTAGADRDLIGGLRKPLPLRSLYACTATMYTSWIPFLVRMAVPARSPAVEGVQFLSAKIQAKPSDTGIGMCHGQ